MFKKYKLSSYNLRLVILLIATTVFGIALINSADSRYTVQQIIGLILSLAIMFVVSFIDYTWISRYYWVWYGICIALLILVKRFGATSKGATRWLRFPGGFQFQPSEITKVALIIFTARLLSMYKEKLNTFKFLALLAVLLGVPLVLVVIEPDLSQTILMVLILFTIIFCAGLHYRIIGIALLIIVPVATGMIMYISNPNQKLLKDYQRSRIMAFVDPEQYDDKNYQQKYSVQAIGSGQLTGKGLNNDDPTSLKNGNFIAEAHTDFIFAVAGEELGFVGCSIIILLLSWIVIECIIAAVRAKDFEGRLICCGMAAYIAFQSFINIGVVTRILPNTGLALPFFSYGLTSLVTLYISMGIVLNISLQRNVEKDDDIFADDFKF